MERIPTSPPGIAPLDPAAGRPLWSVMIPAYNCSFFLPEAIESVLAQDLGEARMQIEVVDDGSTDTDVETLVKEVGRGRVGYHRQPQNVGSLRNFETCINRATGYYVHLLHGDDKVRPGFYTGLTALFETYPQAAAAFCSWNVIDEENNLLRRSDVEAPQPGLLKDWLYKLAEHPRIQYVAMAVKREVYEELGGFYAVTYGEDWEMWARIARQYPTAYTPEILAEYREHPQSISGASFQSAQNMKDIAKVIKTIAGYVEPKRQRQTKRMACRNYVYWAFSRTKEFWIHDGAIKPIIRQLREMVRVHRDFRFLKEVTKLLLGITVSLLKQFVKTALRLMPIEGSFQICHLQLDAQTELLLSEKDCEKGRYLVFWWMDVPLGHLYVAKGEQLSKMTLRRKIIYSIQPVVARYANRRASCSQGQSTAGSKSTFIERRLKEELSSLCPHSFPEKVNVSVIICTRNRSESLRLCLDSLYRQATRPAEIIVVDNMPDDESTKTLVESYNEVIYCRELRLGLDIARNTGAKKASCPIVAYTDDDVCVHPHWLFRIWEAFQNPTVHAVTGLVLPSSLDTKSQQIFERYWSFNKGFVDVFFTKDFLCTGSVPKVWEIGAGANMAFRKSILQEIGFFDERLDAGKAGCNGDSEAWYRVLAAGYRIHYMPRAVVFHEHRREMRALRSQLFYYMRGFAASMLVQDAHNRNIGYKKHLFMQMPRYYLLLLRAGFPFYSFRYCTLLAEMRGMVSGILFFYRHRKTEQVTS